MNKRITLLIIIALTLFAYQSQAQDNRDSAPPTTAEGDSLLAGVASADDTKFDYYFIEAMIARQKGNSTGAFDLLRHCVEINPQSAAAHFYLSQYYNEMKDKAKALECVSKAAELSPRNTTYLETLAGLHVNAKNYAEAIKAVERLVAEDTGRTDMLELLFQLYEMQEDYANAVKTITRLETLLGKSEQLSYRKSRLYSTMGNEEAALAEMKTLADEHPNDPMYRSLYAEVLIANGRDDEAMAILTDILREDSTNVKALTAMYAYYSENDDAPNMQRTAERLLLSKAASDEMKIRILRNEMGYAERTDRDSTKMLRYFNMLMAEPEPSVELALFYAVYMDYKKMPQDSLKRVLERVLDIAPDNVAARQNLLAFAWEKNDMNRVIELCADARRYNPEEMMFYYYQGLAYYRIGDNDKALGAFRNGISVITKESKPEMVSDFYSVMGDLLHAKKDYDAAFAAYDSCLQWKPDNIGCLNNYAYFLSTENRQLDKAEKMSHKAISAEPENATYLDTYAWILFLQERYSESKVYIDKAMACDSMGNSVILEHAGDIYAMTGNVDRAVELWKEAAVKDRKNKLLATKIKKRKYLKK